MARLKCDIQIRRAQRLDSWDRSWHNLRLMDDDLRSCRDFPRFRQMLPILIVQAQFASFLGCEEQYATCFRNSGPSRTESLDRPKNSNPSA
jgi:hypothetical protein